MNNGIGYIGVGWCKTCNGLRIRIPQGRKNICGECANALPKPLRIADPDWPEGVEVGWADRRSLMDANSVRTRLTLETGEYIERRAHATQDDTLAAVEGIRADTYAVLRYPATPEQSAPEQATQMHRIALEQVQGRVVGRIQENENGQHGRLLRSAVAMHIETLAKHYAENAAASAAWAITRARIVALAGNGATSLGIHDAERQLWAARTPLGETIAIAPIIDGQWNGKLLSPRQNETLLRSC